MSSRWQEAKKKRLAAFLLRNARQRWKDDPKNMKAQKHIHTYVRRDKNTYKCDDPHCGHWKLRLDVKGKATICSKCRTNEAIMNEKNMRRAYPVCAQCDQSRDAIAKRERTEMLEGLFK